MRRACASPSAYWRPVGIAPDTLAGYLCLDEVRIPWDDVLAARLAVAF